MVRTEIFMILVVGIYLVFGHSTAGVSVVVVAFMDIPPSLSFFLSRGHASSSITAQALF